jgi:hypothetical protein
LPEHTKYISPEEIKVALKTVLNMKSQSYSQNILCTHKMVVFKSEKEFLRKYSKSFGMSPVIML